MALLVFCLVAALACVAVALFARIPGPARMAAWALAPLLVVFGFIMGSSVSVPADQSGVVVRLIGSPLPAGEIVARHGEQGPQAEVLGPGWHFGYLPGFYAVELAQVMEIEQGKLGVVTALDGAPMAAGETYAKAWDNPADMLDPKTFLEKGGERGPQSTVLTPGTWRFNPRLHKIVTIDALVVAPGTVAVIKANTGDLPKPDGAELVNGIPLVAKGERGIWREALPPGAYYLNTLAYMPTTVKTSQRVYTYQAAGAHMTAAKAAEAGDWSVTVRSKDGFSFPVDVRVGCAVEAKDAPYLVALLGDPDLRNRDEQEDEDLEVLEAKVILPAVRAIFRNVAETMNALEFVNARSTIEQVATAAMQKELSGYHITCSGVFVGNIHLDATDAGKQLIATQTDREVAVNQQSLYAEQRKAQESRAAFVKAEEDAEQQRNLAQATYQVQVKEQEALARAAEAKGESEYQTITGEGRAKAYEAMVKALGREQVAQLELLKLVAEGKVQITPQVMVVGGSGSGVNDALAGTILRQAATDLTASTPAPVSATAAATR
jgi:regulator of protease activity HflC (stomatin/prohibitin superfamily)